MFNKKQIASVMVCGYVRILCATLSGSVYIKIKNTVCYVWVKAFTDTSMSHEAWWHFFLKNQINAACMLEAGSSETVIVFGWLQTDMETITTEALS